MRRVWRARSAAACLLLSLLACACAWALVSSAIWPEAPGERVAADAGLTVDYSNAGEGYVMAKAVSEKRLKLRVARDGETLTYDLNGRGEYEAFPLQLGSGRYSCALYENVSGNRYAQAGSVSFEAELEDERAPFLCPNQYVNYAPDSPAVAAAEALCAGLTSDAEKYEAVRAYIRENFLYDYVKAVTAAPGLMPDVDGCMETRMGICQDLAALAACMLRSQGVPAKFVIGYADDTYHAWTVVLLEGGETLYDPTADVSGTGAGAVYTAERVY